MNRNKCKANFMFDLKGVTYAYIKDIKSDEAKKGKAIKNLLKPKKNTSNSTKGQNKYEKVICPAKKDQMQSLENMSDLNVTNIATCILLVVLIIKYLTIMILNLTLQNDWFT